MEFICSRKRCFYFGLVLFSFLGCCWSIDTLRPGQFIKDTNFLVSNDSAFKLGNVILMNGQNETLWSTNVSKSSAGLMVQLLDSGNLMLQGSDGSLLWQSIEHLGNTLFRKARVSSNPKTGEKKYLTS
uniref:Bulb-type lectin domain-containing protein n=1 Tax=Kalanchoe fedtschenkoi TaxID=63787 RepID=A0A7N0UNG2_KALFE